MAPVLIAFAVGACGNKIGDSCRTSVDCSQESERTCDISQPGGYCTVDGCDERSCPDEAVCIRFFPHKYLSKSCSDTEPRVPCETPDEICLPEGKCAPRASERRYCALECKSSGDCRGGYECRASGTRGSVALVATPGSIVGFCAPAAP